MCRIVIVAHREQKINRFRMFGIKNGNNEKTPLAGCGLSYSTREVYTAKAFGYSGGERGCYRRSDEFGRGFRF